jgi:hypothetical protein
LPPINKESTQLVEAPVTGQPPGQLKRGMIAAAGYALAQLVDLAPLSQPPGKHSSATSSPAAASGRMTSMASSVLARSDSQLPPGVLVPGSGALAKLTDLVASSCPG